MSERLLLVKLSSLGDVIHALPLAETLRAGLPDARLVWAVREKFADILSGCPHIDSLAVFGKESPLAFGQRLRRENITLALDAQGLFISGLVTYLSGAPRRIGYDLNREGNRLFLTGVVPAKERVHMVEKTLRLADALQVPRLTPRPQRWLADAESEHAEGLLGEIRGEGPPIGLIIGASTPEKAWPEAHWTSLVRRLASDGLRPILLGGPNEVALAEAISAACGDALGASLVGRTPLRTLAGVLARCRVVVGGDSGPTHLAVGVGAPVVGLYGVTDPARTGPDWGSAPAIVLDEAVRDAPPALRRPRRPTLDDALARIAPDSVATAISHLL